MRTVLGVIAVCVALGACADPYITPPIAPPPAVSQSAPPQASAAPVPRQSPAPRQLNAADEAVLALTAQTALEGNPPNEPLPWRGQSGSGSVIPGDYYETPDGQYCRAFDETVTVGGETRRSHGNACREPDGTWRMVRN